jgi:hypothetical protein
MVMVKWLPWCKEQLQVKAWAYIEEKRKEDNLLLLQRTEENECRGPAARIQEGTPVDG